MRVDITEGTAASLPGGVGLAVAAALLALGVLALALLPEVAKAFSILFFAAFFLALTSLVIVQPGQTKVVQFFGRYMGTVRHTGMSTVVPLSTRRSVSVRVRNFETNRLKVNDADGSPVEIAAIVVWQVADTSKAISHLAYAAEVAQAMLRRQQANAVVAARTRIVEGAVGMVDLALTKLSEDNIVELDDERKAAMVSNLMVVLCSDQPATPIVNAGTLYSS